VDSPKKKDTLHSSDAQARLTKDSTGVRFAASHCGWAQHQHPKFLIVRNYHAKSILDVCFNGDFADG
jgi:hypothetical protein